MRVNRHIVLGLIIATERDDKTEALQLLAKAVDYDLFDPEIKEYRPPLRLSATEEEVEADREVLRRFRNRYCKVTP